MPKGVYDRKLANQLNEHAAQQYDSSALQNQLADQSAAALQGYAAAAPANPEVEALKAELAVMKAKLERRDEIRAELSEALRAQEEERRRIEFGKRALPEPFKMPAKVDGRLVTVKLDRNYCPQGYHEVVGYQKEAVVRRHPSGRVEVIEEAEWKPGEIKPSAAGVSFEAGKHRKVWAGTHIRVPEDEARRVIAEKIGSIQLD